MGAWNCWAHQLRILPLLLVKLYIIFNFTRGSRNRSDTNRSTALMKKYSNKMHARKLILEHCQGGYWLYSKCVSCTCHISPGTGKCRKQRNAPSMSYLVSAEKDVDSLPRLFWNFLSLTFVWMALLRWAICSQLSSPWQSKTMVITLQLHYTWS